MNLYFDAQCRRRFLSRAMQQFLGVSFLATLTRSEGFADNQKHAVMKGTARRVIYIYLNGGLSHLDTFDAKANSEVMGPVKSLPTEVPDLTFTEYVPQLARRAGHLAVVRSLESTQGAHPQGNYYMHTSHTPDSSVLHPAMGGWLAKHRSGENVTLHNNVMIGSASRHPGAGFLESRFAPLCITNPANGLSYSNSMVEPDSLIRERRLADQIDAMFTARYDQKNVRAYNDMYHDAIRLMGSKDLDAFDISKESSATRSRYGQNSLGQGCLLARRLVEHDVGFIEVNDGGWDTHTQNFPRVREKCQELDHALSALIDDLLDSGSLKDTLVVLATEFGRSPEINVNDGRDHNPTAFTCLMAGGGVTGGRAYGVSDDRGKTVDEDAVTIPDFNATIAYALGLPIEQEFKSPSQRSFRIADDGLPILSLFG